MCNFWSRLHLVSTIFRYKKAQANFWSFFHIIGRFKTIKLKINYKFSLEELKVST